MRNDLRELERNFLNANTHAFNRLVHRINWSTALRCRPLYRGTVVDLGCGTCPYRDLIVGEGAHYFGLDWPKSPLDTSDADVLADVSRAIPLRTAVADTVVAFQVLEHLPEPAEFLAECRRILRPGGHLLLTVPFMWQVHDSPHDYYRFTRFGLEYLLSRAGFSEVAVAETTGFWQTCVLKFNYHTAHFESGPLKYPLMPLWWFGETVAPILDRFDRHSEETASYVATAMNPLAGRRGA